MRLLKLSLINFRNHRNVNLEFSPLADSPNLGQSEPTTVIVGANASGKTNILEAIFLLATGDSFREGKIEERVAFGAEVGHIACKLKTQSAKVKSNESADADELELQVTLTRGMIGGKRVSKRRLLVNGVGRSKQKFVGNLQVVVFRPEDLRIIEGSPGRRRKFLDEVLIQADREYARSLASYNKALVRRNKLLDMIRDGKTKRNVLTYWDHLVLKEGEFVQTKRRGLVERFNRGFEEEKFEDGEGFLTNLQMEYDISVMSPARMREYADREVLAGHTLVGPHRDDFVVNSKSEIRNPKQIQNSNDQNFKLRNLAVYGSRGEQRLGVLWLKLMSLLYLEEMNEERPLLLLDDIFSELDHPHRQLVHGLLGRQQTIITTADGHYIEGIRAQEIKLPID